ncbi:antibiotic biosynthesis monooxygenase [Vibrio fluminensis]|uniref:antibiotic biosynthesis monooxygenase n=1 Tax=Vibrio fluminensis TaxID=2783614 RepID=UPI001889237F|nr:hypothetical protein [Vibrio fluminensis]
MQQVKLISEIVNPSYLSEYQTWLKSMNQSVRAYPGFISLNIIEPRNQQQLEFLILVRFDSEQSLVNWESEESTRSMLKLSKKWLNRSENTQEKIAPELWFGVSNLPSRPAFYKQVLLGVLAVYPLVTSLGFFVSPHLEGLDKNLSTLVLVSLVSVFMTYPVMPMLTRFLRPWLNR